MSGLPWVKVATDLLDHPKATALAHRLGDPRAAFFPIAVWFYLARFCPAGFMPDNEDSARVLEAAARWTGEAGALLAALIEVGFVDRKRGRIVAHGWGEWQGPHVEKLARDRRRMAAKRAEARRAGASSVDAARPPEKFEGAGSPDTTQPPEVPRDESRDRRALDGDGDGDETETETSSSAGRLARATGFAAFAVGVAARLGVPAVPVGGKGHKAAGVEAAIAAEVQRLGLPRALEVASAAIGEADPTDPPRTLRYFVGWLQREPTPASGNGAASEPPARVPAAPPPPRPRAPQGPPPPPPRPLLMRHQVAAALERGFARDLTAEDHAVIGDLLSLDLTLPELESRSGRLAAEAPGAGVAKLVTEWERLGDPAEEQPL